MPPFANFWLAPLAPVLRLQGKRLRQAMPTLPIPAGPDKGRCEGNTPGLQVVFIGESTIAGVGVQHTSEALPALMAEELATRTGQAVAWHVFGKSGATVADNDEQLARIEEQRSELDHADLAVIAMGVSDTIAFTTPRRFFARMDCLIMRLRLLLWPLPVLLAGVPRLDRFPASLPQPLRLALRRRCRSLDKALTRISEEGFQTLHWPVFQPPGASHAAQAFAPDSFHPGPVGYQLWARHLALGAVTLLENIEERADYRQQSALDL